MEFPENESTILDATLSLHPKSKSVFVSVSKKCITVQPAKSHQRQHDSPTDEGSSFHQIQLADVVGCQCAKGKASSNQNAYLSIFAYPHVKKFGSKKTTRQRQVKTLIFDAGKDFQENNATAMQWKAVLCNLLRNIEVTRSEAFLPSLKSPEALDYLVLVNPFSGPGKALQIFQQRIVPVIAEAGIRYHLRVTEYAGHAKKIARTLKLDEWSGILIVSGDGLIFEVVNGLMARDDWEKAIKLPIGALPGGSGNALCCSLLFRADEPYLDNCVLHAAFMIAKHAVAPMDLVAVDLSSGERLYSFLSVGWGIIADVDIESEKYRSLGNTRFTVGALVRILGLRKYRGRLSFLPADGSPRHIKRSQSEMLHTVQDSQGNTGKYLEHSISMVDTRTANRKEKVTKLSGGAKKQESGDSRVSVTREPTKTGESVITDGGVASEKTAPEVETSLLVPLTEPVPAAWTTVEDDFVAVIGLYQTHIAQDMVAAIDSKLDDGLIHLMFMRGNASRVRLIQLFAAMLSAEPLPDDPALDCVKVRAFRLEPLTANGNLTVDGEVVPYGPIQAQVLPSMARVMTLRTTDHPETTQL